MEIGLGGSSGSLFRPFEEAGFFDAESWFLFCFFYMANVRGFGFVVRVWEKSWGSCIVCVIILIFEKYIGEVILISVDWFLLKNGIFSYTLKYTISDVFQITHLSRTNWFHIRKTPSKSQPPSISLHTRPHTESKKKKFASLTTALKVANHFLRLAYYNETSSQNSFFFFNFTLGVFNARAWDGFTRLRAWDYLFSKPVVYTRKKQLINSFIIHIPHLYTNSYPHFEESDTYISSRSRRFFARRHDAMDFPEARETRAHMQTPTRPRYILHMRVLILLGYPLPFPPRCCYYLCSFIVCVYERR